MKALFISHKPCWSHGSTLVTDGGFPDQVAALSGLFDQTVLLVTRRSGEAPPGTRPLGGTRLTTLALPEPTGRGFLRKALLGLWWIPRQGSLLREARKSDLVHAMVPGDIGTLGIVAARLTRRRLVVRHCGTWGNSETHADRFLASWLPRLANGGSVVFATGGDVEPPQPASRDLHWIFSTAISQAELAQLECATPWTPGEPLRIVTVGRMTAGKNQAAAVTALPTIRRAHPGATLEILGDGPERPRLVQLATEAGVAEAVRIRGNVTREEVISALELAHVFVFPTRVAEGFPKAVLEALACGVPVLAPPVSVIPRLLAEGGGRVLTGTDSHAVANGVLELLAAPKKLPSMGQAGRRTASAYTLEAWQMKIGSVLEARWGPLKTENRAE